MKLIFVALVLTVVGCSGSSNQFDILQHPVDIKASSTDIVVDSEVTRLAYVANETGGSVSVLDQRREKFVDTDAWDDFDNSPITVGGEPVALAIQELEIPRVFVADALNRRIWAFDAHEPIAETPKIVKHTSVDLGGAEVGVASEPLFRNSGRRSNPVMQEVTVDASLAQREHWEVKFEGDSKGYRVKGSKSGEQVNRAVENETYTTDDGAVSFKIVPGGEPTTKDDTFRFGTNIGSPLELSGKPVDLVLGEDKLYVITADPSEVAVVDLSTFEVEDEVAFAAQPGRVAFANGMIFIPDKVTANIFRFDTSDLSIVPFPCDEPAVAASVDGVSEVLYLFPAGIRTVQRWDMDEEEMLTPISLSDFGAGLFPFTINDHNYGLVPLSAGPIDVIDVDNQFRVDTHVTSEETQSDAFGEEFFDELPKSEPQLAAINTEDGVTVTERWQLTYEGVVPSASGLEGTVSGSEFTVSGASFLSNGVQPGDVLILDPYGSSQEVTIEDVVSDETLALESTPALQGSRDAEVRVVESYLVIGSVSGVQEGRVREAVPYTSDNGAIALAIRPSALSPTSRGDFFTFITSDGTEPISTGQKHLGRSAAVFVRPDESVPTAYVVFSGSNSISVVNLETLDERKTIH
jgi:hypothetical protein